MNKNKNAVNEVRVKLHIIKSNETSVNNTWMCLNYSQKPTIAHIIEHLKANYAHVADDDTIVDTPSKHLKHGSEINEDLVKLYLDDYWLPPNENSRLIREDDCIKVEIKQLENWKNNKQKEHRRMEEKSAVNLNSNEQMNKAGSQSKKSSSLPFASSTNDHHQQAVDAYYSQSNYSYPSYIQTDSYPVKDCHKNETSTLAAKKLPKSNDSDKLNVRKSSPTVSVEQKKQQQQQQQPSKLHSPPIEKQRIVEKKQPTRQTEATITTNNVSANAKKITNAYKKFAIGNYAHLLYEKNDNNLDGKKSNRSSSSSSSDSDDDDVSEEQIIDNYYKTIQKGRKDDVAGVSQNGNVKDTDDLDKIATSINSHGKAKWKNSTKVTTKPNGPKHIRFSSTDSSSTSSSSSSSSEEENEANNSKPAAARVTSITNKEKSKEQHAQKEIQTKISNYYEPSKEEQLNALSNNRTFIVKNTQDLSNFKKVFNQAKLNAPGAEEFLDLESTDMQSEKKTSTGSLKKKKNEQQTNGDEEEDHYAKAPQSPVKIDYNQFEALNGAPRVDDRIAFQILEISSNFTPEISDYKIGTVTEFDSSSNEVTLKLSSLYNSVLKKPSKFSVVLEEDEKEEEEEELNGIDKEQQDQERKDVNEDMIKVDWRNLMNVKLVPQDRWPSPKATTHTA